MTTFVPALAAKIIISGVDQGRKVSLALWAVKPVPAAPTAAELTALATAVAGVIPGNAFLADISPSVTLQEVEARDASVERGPSESVIINVSGTAATGNTSAIAAKVLVEPASGVFQFRPSQAFLPGVPIAALTEPGSDTLTTAYTTAATTFITSLATAIATVSTYALGAASKFLHAVPRATALVSQSSGHSVRPTVATQVRRLRRVARK